MYKRTGDTFTEVASGIDVSSKFVSYSPLGNYIVVCDTRAPYLSIYKQSGDVFTSLGTPAGTPVDRQANTCDWTADEKYGESGVRVLERTDDGWRILSPLSLLPLSRQLSPVWSPDGSF